MEYKATGAYMLTTVEEMLVPDASWKFEKEQVGTQYPVTCCGHVMTYSLLPNPQAGITCYSMTRNGVKIWRADVSFWVTPFTIVSL